jgi:hypothetical protein
MIAPSTTYAPWLPGAQIDVETALRNALKPSLMSLDMGAYEASFR